MSVTKVQLQPPAKVNLSLSVGALNAEGMHPIASKMACIDLCDDLELTRLDEDVLSRYAVFWHDDAPRSSTIDWSIRNDLAVQAHRMLEAEVGHPLPVQLKLQKRIPVGGGLGGGSSDAAAMLHATATLFQLDVDLAAIGKNLGSDIPFLLKGGCAIVTGVGETIEPLQLEETHLVLVMPAYGCPTGEVYDSFDELGAGTLDEERVRSGALFNDLFNAACHAVDELAEDVSTLQTVTNCEIHLSGSGSTMFVICDNAKSATSLAQKIEEHTTLVATATKTCVPKKVLENDSCQQ